jgi:hypothetical protein
MEKPNKRKEEDDDIKGGKKAEHPSKKQKTRTKDKEIGTEALPEERLKKPKVEKKVSKRPTSDLKSGHELKDANSKKSVSKGEEAPTKKEKEKRSKKAKN